MQKILEKVNPNEYPKLKFNFITNGVLFTENFGKTEKTYIPW